MKGLFRRSEQPVAAIDGAGQGLMVPGLTAPDRGQPTRIPGDQVREQEAILNKAPYNLTEPAAEKKS